MWLAYVMKRGRSRCCLHVCLISLKWASWSEVRNLLKAAAHPQSLCLDVQELFGSYHHHTHGQGRPRSPIRQRQCNYNCLRPALFYNIVYYIVLHTTIYTDTALLSSSKPSVWRRTPVCADNATGGCRL